MVSTSVDEVEQKAILRDVSLNGPTRTRTKRLIAKELTIDALCDESRRFAEIESQHAEPSLHGVSDGKAVGTYLEHKFRAYLTADYAFTAGNSANGIDFPVLGVDMKVTSIKQPQSSCPFTEAGAVEGIRRIR